MPWNHSFLLWCFCLLSTMLWCHQADATCDLKTGRTQVPASAYKKASSRLVRHSCSAGATRLVQKPPSACENAATKKKVAKIQFVGFLIAGGIFVVGMTLLIAGVARANVVWADAYPILSGAARRGSFTPSEIETLKRYKGEMEAMEAMFHTGAIIAPLAMIPLFFVSGLGNTTNWNAGLRKPPVLLAKKRKQRRRVLLWPSEGGP